MLYMSFDNQFVWFDVLFSLGKHEGDKVSVEDHAPFLVHSCSQHLIHLLLCEWFPWRGRESKREGEEGGRRVRGRGKKERGGGGREREEGGGNV